MDITKRPKQLIHTDDIKPQRYKEPFTLKKLLTDDDSHPERISYLKQLSARKGPWGEYYNFYLRNMSGDIDTMNPETRKYVEKMVKEIKTQYTEEMG